MNLVLKSLQTEDLLSPLILRVVLATVIFPHGAQMAFGWFGGGGFAGSMNYLTQFEKLPWLVGVLVILLQLLAPIFLLIGLGTRMVSISVIGLFIGMVFTSHLNHGFFMNWVGNQEGEGFEYHILVIGMSIALISTGGGLYSLDKRFT